MYIDKRLHFNQTFKVLIEEFKNCNNAANTSNKMVSDSPTLFKPTSTSSSDSLGVGSITDLGKKSETDIKPK